MSDMKVHRSSTGSMEINLTLSVSLLGAISWDMGDSLLSYRGRKEYSLVRFRGKVSLLRILQTVNNRVQVKL